MNDARSHRPTTSRLSFGAPLGVHLGRLPRCVRCRRRRLGRVLTPVSTMSVAGPIPRSWVVMDRPQATGAFGGGGTADGRHGCLFRRARRRRWL
jgi:hypothetical protein